MRLAIESLECERQCRIFGAGEVHHVGKTAIRKSDAVHAGIFRVLLDCNEGITTSPMTEEHQANKSLVMASPLPAQTGRYESARHGRSSNPDLIRNFNIYFLPGPTPIQPLEKRAVCVATQGQEITRWFPGAALQLEGSLSISEGKVNTVFSYLQ